MLFRSKREAELKWATDPIEQGNLLIERAEAGERRVTPEGSDKHQPPKGVLWKVEPNGGMIIKELRLPKTFRKSSRVQARNVLHSKDSSNANPTNV